MIATTRILILAAAACLPMAVCSAQPPAANDTPASLGFAQFYKCPSDGDADRLGDTVTAEACLAACEARKPAAGCWWLDGTGGFARECRVCRTMTPTRQVWPNDWARPLMVLIS